MHLYQLGQAQVQGQAGGQQQPGIGHHAMIVNGEVDAVRMVAWQHLIGVHFREPVFYEKPPSPNTGTPSCSLSTPTDSLFWWARRLAGASLTGGSCQGFVLQEFLEELLDR